MSSSKRRQRSPGTAIQIRQLEMLELSQRTTKLQALRTTTIRNIKNLEGSGKLRLIEITMQLLDYYCN